MASLAIPLAISGISALGGLFGNRGTKQTQTSNSTENMSASETPNYDPVALFLRNYLINSQLDRLQEDDSNLWDSYAVNGLQEYNNAEKTNNNLIQQFLTSRGLSSTGAGVSTLADTAMNSQMNKVNFLNQIPMLRDQRRASNLDNALKLFSSIPYGSSKTGTSTTNSSSTGTGSGNMLGGALTGAGSSLAYLFGRGAFDKKPVTPTGPTGPRFPGMM